MSEIFEGANGVALDEHGHAIRNSKKDMTSAEVHEARKEFYQYLRDKELGRWRDPVLYYFVVYPNPENDNAFYVINEFLGTPTEVTLNGAGRLPSTLDAFTRNIAKRFLEERKPPKPWHDAQPGELWNLAIEDGEVFTGLAVKREADSEIVFIGPDGQEWALSEIIDGKRVWSGEENETV